VWGAPPPSGWYQVCETLLIPLPSFPDVLLLFVGKLHMLSDEVAEAQRNSGTLPVISLGKDAESWLFWAKPGN